jgi:type IV secretion system protein VirB10
MSRLIALLIAVVLVTTVQAQDNVQSSAASENGSGQASNRQITVPAGTTVLLHLKSPIDTHSARVGDGVYCETSFPVTMDNIMAIPAGTFVKGRITRVERSGRIKGRAELQVHFTTMIFPNGYTVDLPGALQNTPGAENSSVADKEGTVKANGQKGKDAGTIATGAGVGGAVGGLGTGTLKGAGIGGGIGAGIGLIKVLATRGQEVRLPTGTSLEMVLQRPLTLDVGQDTGRTNVRPRLNQNSSMQVR